VSSRPALAVEPETAPLAGRVVLVTGGESGIGRAIAHRCVSAGARVLIAGVDDNLGEEAAGVLGDRAAYVHTDVRDPEQIERALDHARDELGGLDGVVANAGTVPGGGPFLELTLDDWYRSLEVTLTGAFLTLQAGARRLVEAGRGGALIAIGSSTVLRPHGARYLGYVAGKGGVHAMIKALAYELAPHGIRVNAIAPGMTDTPLARGVAGHIQRGLEIVPMGELVDPDEIGALAALMLGPQARHMTGSIVSLDAGRTAD